MKIKSLALTALLAFSTGCASVGGVLHDLTPKIEDLGTQAGVSLTIDPDGIVDSVVFCIPLDSKLLGVPFLGEALATVVGVCLPDAEVPPVE